jgi:uncharacterized protein (DUF2345 family)
VLGSLFNGQDTPGEDLVHGQDGSFVVKSNKQILAASKEDLSLTSHGKALIEATNNLTITGHAEIEIGGSTKVTLKCGDTQIELSSAGVQITGQMIKLG